MITRTNEQHKLEWKKFEHWRFVQQCRGHHKGHKQLE